MKNRLKRFKNTRFFSLIVVLLFIAICVGIGMIAAYIHHESDPTEVAVQYFRAIVKQDYKTAETLIDQTNISYVNQDVLEKILQKENNELHFNSYEIKEPKKKNGKILVLFKLSNNETGKTTDFPIYLNKSYKCFNPIPEYKINIDDFVKQNYEEASFNRDVEVIEKEVQNLLKELMKSVRKKNPKIKSLSGLVSQNLKKNVEKEAKKMINVVFTEEKGENYEIASLKLGDPKVTVSYNKKEQVYDVQTSFRFNYKCRTKTTLINSYTEEYRGRCKSKMNLKCTVDKDKIHILKISIKNQ